MSVIGSTEHDMNEPENTRELKGKIQEWRGVLGVKGGAWGVEWGRGGRGAAMVTCN